MPRPHQTLSRSHRSTSSNETHRKPVTLKQEPYAVRNDGEAIELAPPRPNVESDLARDEFARRRGVFQARTTAAAEAANSQDDEMPYPEGGLQAWLVVLGSFAATLVSLGTVSTIGIFHSYLSEHQLENYSESTIGWIFSVYVFLAFFCGIQIGPIFDMYGPRLLMLVGGICMTVEMLLLGICVHYWEFMVVFGILGGVGTSLLFTPAFAAIGHFFNEKRGNASGIAAAGGALGGIVFPLMLQQLFPQLGFIWATRVVALIFFCCTMVAVALVRSRLSPKPGQSIAPDLRILKQRDYLFATLGIYFMEWALFVPITYLTTFATSTGVLSPSFSYKLIAIMNAGSCLGRWGSGTIADKIGRFNSMIATLALCAATTITLWLPVSLLGSSATDVSATKGIIIAYAITFGVASGSNISLAPVCVGQLCRTNNYGRYYATCYTVVSFGTLTGIPIAGVLIQAAGGRYWAVVCWTFLCYLASLMCCVRSRAYQVGWKWGRKV